MKEPLQHHPPLSESLRELVANVPADQPLTLDILLDHTGGRGGFLVMILLCLPFCQPVPLPGVSTVVGIVLVLLGVYLALGERATLPRGIGARPLPVFFRTRLLSASVRLLRFIERWVKPRGSKWILWRGVRVFNGLLVVFMALLLSLPIPLPFTNQPPAMAILLVALSTMEEDGVLIWFGYLVALATTLYFALSAGIFVAAIKKMLDLAGYAG
jgi:hypothetical protein